MFLYEKNPDLPLSDLGITLHPDCKTLQDLKEKGQHNAWSDIVGCLAKVMMKVMDKDGNGTVP